MRKIGVAILGVGSMGETHLRAARDSPEVASVIGYEPDPKRAAQRGQDLGIEMISDLDRILNNPAIELVTIAAVNEAHCDLTVRSLGAGKAVLCEKPMGITLEEARQMLAAQQQNDGFLQIGFELRYSKLYERVKQWIDEGLVGRVMNTHCDYVCSEWTLRGSWRSESAGTLIGEKLSHYLDLPRWWVGEEVVEVFSMAAPNIVPYFNHSDNHNILYRFANEAVSSLNFVVGVAQTHSVGDSDDLLEKQVDDGHALRYLIYGTGGAIEVDVFRRRVRRWAFTETPDQHLSELVETVRFTPDEDNEWYHNTYGQNLIIAQLVSEGRPPDHPASDAYETMRLGFAAEIAERERRLVKMSELT